jgi:hypothetical protein
MPSAPVPILPSTCRPRCEKTGSGELTWQVEARARYGPLSDVPSDTRHWMGFVVKYGHWPTRETFALYLLRRYPRNKRALCVDYPGEWEALTADYAAVVAALTPQEAAKRFLESASIERRLDMQRAAGDG